MSVKPIFIVGLPKNMDRTQMESTVNTLHNHPMGAEYHTFVYGTNSDEYTFDAFYPTDFDDITYAELKDFILKNAGK